MLRKPLVILNDARVTLYGLTETRLIRMVDSRTRRIETVRIDKIGPLKCMIGKDGWGTLIVQTGTYVDSDRNRAIETFEVAGVPQVERLHRLIVEQLDKNRGE